jgi:hypothetical protein
VSREAELPDGTVLEFPDGTADEVIDRAVKSHLSQSPEIVDLPRVQAERPNPTEGMGTFDRLAAGFGKSFVDGYEGVKQLGTSAARMMAEANPAMYGVGVQRLRDTSTEQQAETAERRRLDEPLMDTGAGMTGNITGTLAQFLVPGMAARSTAIAPALLPRTLLGNAAQGAVIGSAQPVASEGERLKNAGFGLGGGFIGAAAPKVAGGAYRALSGAVGRPTLAGAEKRAAQVIAAESSGLAGLSIPAPSKVPGVQRTLAEESLDPGIARLERQMRGQTNTFQPIDTANNAARVKAIEGFAGDPSTIAAAEKARRQTTLPLLGQAYTDKGVDVGAIRKAVDDGIAQNATRPSVAAAIRDVKTALDAADDGVSSLYGVRKYIGDLLSGKAGTDKSYAKAASRELKEIQEVLDAKLAEKSPSFAQYLDEYRAGSKPINRMQTGQELLDSGGAVLDPQTGVQVLTPASFSKKARNLDDVAARATGFKKAKADQILEPEDFAVIRAVQDDLERQSFRATAGSGGNSMTQERMKLQDKMGSRLASKLPFVGGFVEALDTIGNHRVNERMAYLLANPAEARRVLAALNRKDRATLNKALFQLSARSGASVPALAE